MTTQPSDACQQLAVADISGSIALAQRGNCSFSVKSEHAAQAGAAGLVIINNSTDCLGSPAPANSSAAGTATSLWIASADNVTAAALLNAATDAHGARAAAIRSVTPHTLDAASVVLWLVAVCTIAAAAIWSGETFRAHLQRRQQAHAQASESLDAGAGTAEGAPAAPLRRGVC